ncbi:hypothetical protein QUF90_17505 [Desulfococcaceae bacterium HSG9]|nr:hypothetical protein [Desulfococcaceae bacterium HSG9]
MAKIIDITVKLWENQDPATAKALDIFLNQLYDEIHIGLGLNHEAPDDQEAPLYDFVQKIYDDANAGCWFCDSRVDPNENHKSARLCIMCAYKLEKLKELPVEALF